MALIALLCGYSCGDDDGVHCEYDDIIRDSCAGACLAVTACAGTYTFDDCYSLYCNQDGLITVPSAKCLDAIESASCEDHDQLGIGSYYDVCFPSCSQATSRCVNDEDALWICAETGGGDLVANTVTCESICKSSESPTAYTGFCGTTTPSGQTSRGGKPVCWCEE